MSEEVALLPLFAVSVRDLVAFVLMQGDLARGVALMTQAYDAAHEGVKAHLELQSSRPEGYQPEVSLKTVVEHEGTLALKLRGRIDGLWEREDGSVQIEEIKTVSASLPDAPRKQHWAQAQLYAWIYLLDHPLDQIEICLTYMSRKTREVRHFIEMLSRTEIEAFAQDAISSYLSWLSRQVAWDAKRDASLRDAPFPYVGYRQGQREMAISSYRTITKRGRCFIEAPTGIGKTMATLFPALKALGEGHARKIFFLTAKTPGRRVAEQALADMREAGMHVRSLTLTAREKLCFGSEDGKPCDTETCPFALGYYDRLKGALEDVFDVEQLDREAIEKLARKHQVCPFEFSLDAALWSDVIICDYNYAFDPKAMLRRFFAEGGDDYVLLVDEAHNLPDRARGMFSAEIEKSPLWELKRALQKDVPVLSKLLHRLNKEFVALGKLLESGEKEGSFEDDEEPDVTFRYFASGTQEACLILSHLPQRIKLLLWEFLVQAEALLATPGEAEYRASLQEQVFVVRDFWRALSWQDESFRLLFVSQGRESRLWLYCLDPSGLLSEMTGRCAATLFFSATLSPPRYFCTLLGGEEGDPFLQLASPFPPEHLQVFVEPGIETTYRARANSYQDIAVAIQQMVAGFAGNYLVFFPSYRYLEEVLVLFLEADPACHVIFQKPGMTEEERDAFLAMYDREQEKPLVGFAVMGGIFGEGVDLVGEKLSGAIIVGVGLPQVGLERDLLREYYEQKEGSGFAYAYIYPGMGRVLQAAGRVIRSEQDKGALLLIDRRFQQRPYRDLFPRWWLPQTFSLKDKR
ncbi:MAG: ATP-dependent DNA helicase [Myxococcales bacterium]|nr:ATP-dependent DNA helicase [Myxococcales bacterium]